MKTIRAQIEPYLRVAGIKATAEAAGIHRVCLQRWLAGGQGLSDAQVEALAAALKLRVVIRPGKR